MRVMLGAHSRIGTSSTASECNRSRKDSTRSALWTSIQSAGTTYSDDGQTLMIALWVYHIGAVLWELRSEVSPTVKILRGTVHYYDSFYCCVFGTVHPRWIVYTCIHVSTEYRFVSSVYVDSRIIWNCVWVYDCVWDCVSVWAVLA